MWLPWKGQPTGSHLRYPCRKENCFTWLSTNTSRDHTKVSNSWSPSNRETPTNPATPYGCSFSLKSSSVGPEPHLMARRQQSYGCLTLQLAQSKEHRQWFHTGLSLLFDCEPMSLQTCGLHSVSEWGFRNIFWTYQVAKPSAWTWGP